MSGICYQFPTKRLALLSGVLSVTLNSGCTASSVAPSSAVLECEAHVSQVPSDWIPVDRYGRYTLVELSREASQQNLLLQIVDVSIPANQAKNIREALNHVLLHSGYTLCEGGTDAATLYSLPLPAPHRHLGPLLLYDALRTLAGPAWVLEVDNTTRQVCFTRTGAPKP